jgi:hypothetical protein
LVRAFAGLGFACLAGSASAAIALYGQENFGGRTFRIDRDAPDLDRTVFNDRASSVVIESGRWELCTDANYRGNCRTLGPGEYPVLGGVLTDRVSSVRQVDDAFRHVPDAARLDGADPGSSGAAAAATELTLFSSNGLSGRAFTAREPVDNLAVAGFEGSAWSADVHDGSWQLCTETRFRGECYVLGPGRYRILPGAIGGRISSIRPLDRRVSSIGSGVRLYSDSNFRGPSLNVFDRADDLESYEFSNRTGSLYVYEGRWEACERPNYGGRCLVFGPGEYRALGWLSDRISSIRRIG